MDTSNDIDNVFNKLAEDLKYNNNVQALGKGIDTVYIYLKRNKKIDNLDDTMDNIKIEQIHIGTVKPG